MGCGSGMLSMSLLDDGDVDAQRMPVATFLRENAERGDVGAERARFNTDMADARRLLGRETAESERPDDMQVLKQLFKQLDPVVMRSTAKAQGELQLAMKHQTHSHDSDASTSPTSAFHKDQLLVHVARARDLVAMDLRSKSSDPYITMELLPRQQQDNMVSPCVVQSRIVQQTLNPVFNEYLTIPLDRELIADSFLWVRMWDHDNLSDDDPMGFVVIPLESQLPDLMTANPTPRWYSLQPEVENPITGHVDLTLDWQPPVQLDCLVHSVKNVLLCRQVAVQDNDQQPLLHYVVVCHMDSEEQVNISEAEVGQSSAVFNTLFSYRVAAGDVESRLLHVRVMALEVEAGGGSHATGDGSLSIDVMDPEEVVYSGFMAGECYVDLSGISGINGTRLSLSLSDQRGDNVRSAGTKVSARSQELQQSLQAHAQYGYPSLLFRSESHGEKVVHLQSSATRKAAQMHLRDGVPVIRGR